MSRRQWFRMMRSGRHATVGPWHLATTPAVCAAVCGVKARGPLDTESYHGLPVGPGTICPGCARAFKALIEHQYVEQRQHPLGRQDGHSSGIYASCTCGWTQPDPGPLTVAGRRKLWGAHRVLSRPSPAGG